MSDLNYWEECIAQSAESCDLKLTKEQLETLASDVSISHEHYGMAFYSPPDSDRYSDLEDEYKKKIKDLEREFNKYKDNAETAVKQALRQYSDSQVTIGEHGEVLRHGGRTVRIQ